MPPNLLFKAAFIRGEVDGFKKRYYTKNDIIRTDFILENVYSYLLEGHYHFDAMSAINEIENDVFESMKQTLRIFRDNYENPVKSLCAEIPVINEDTVGSILLGVSNELFSEGITWSRIIAYFVFVGELAIMSKNESKSMVDVTYECYSRSVKEKLESWIEDHGGWEGMKDLVPVQQTSPEEYFSLKKSKPSWAKSLLHTTIRMIGTFTSIVNTPNYIS